MQADHLVIYTKPGCGFSERAIRFCQNQDIRYEEHRNAQQNETVHRDMMRRLIAEDGQHHTTTASTFVTYPRIFAVTEGGRRWTLIGGSDDLADWWQQAHQELHRFVGGSRGGRDSEPTQRWWQWW